MSIAAVVVWLSPWVVSACHEAGKPIHEQTVSVGCGTCVFHMQGMSGCFWAVEIDGEHYPVGGITPPSDMVSAHEPGGMCTAMRSAVVSGEIRPDGRFLATQFTLLPDERDIEAPAHSHTH